MADANVLKTNLLILGFLAAAATAPAESLTRNQLSSTAEVVAAVEEGLPDLTSDYCEYLTQKKQSMKLTIDINNIGTGTSGKSDAILYFADNPDNINPVFLKRYKLSKMKPGKIKKLKYKVKDRSSWRGNYLYVWIDGMYAVPESSEDNNYIYYGPFPTDL